MGDEFTIVWIPDTQFATGLDPTIFDAQMQWIADNQAALNIQLVLHVGDIVQTGSTESQWVDADEAMDILDGANIPYLLAPGNHDYNTVSTRTATLLNTYFGQSRYTGQSWWNGGFYEEGKAENIYLLMTIGGRSYLILVLELFPRQGVIDWADALISANSERDTIIVTHGYMSGDGTRIEDPGSPFGPDDYGLADSHDGEAIWDELISRHPNIVIIGSGHTYGVNHRTDVVPGALLHQFVADYCGYDAGLGGWLRIMTVTPSAGLIIMTTYSPTQDLSKTGVPHEFSLLYRAVSCQ